MNGLIVILIDGLGADYFARHRNSLPNLNAFAEAGCLVNRLGVDMCAASMPGRTSIITGVPPAEHGIYSNVIWDGARFRSVNSTDIRVISLPVQASLAGLDVASIGFGMIGPDGCNVFHTPYWAEEMLDSLAEGTLSKTDAVWLEEIAAIDSSGRIAALVERGLTTVLPAWSVASSPHQIADGQACDQTFINWTAALATGDQVPDLILTEIASPDYSLHQYDCSSVAGNKAIDKADAQIGQLISCLRRNNALQNFNIAVLSDHGFSNITESIHPDVILPEFKFACAAGVLHVHYQSQSQLEDVARELSLHEVTALDNRYLPLDQRAEVAAFLAPTGCDFYLDHLQSGLARSPSKYRATHGFGPGIAADERFCVFIGPDIPQMTVERASAGQIAPTLASLVGLQTDAYPEAVLF